jgi:hypothetical protein
MENMIINHWAVLTSSVLMLVLGGLWYSPLMFVNAWMAETGVTPEKAKKAGFRPMILSFIIAVIMSYNLAFFLGDAQTDWLWGLTAGFLAGFGWAALSFLVIALFELRSLRYILINGGFITLYLSLAGLIIGAWR